MKTYISNILLAALVGLTMSGCTADAPFSGEGTGVVRMNVAINSAATRGPVTGDALTELENKCVIYISDRQGLLHKWVGVQNLPSEIALKYDSYIAEAWSGDSVSASFESKFFKGLQRFSVSSEVPSQTIAIECKIANVIVSVNTETIDATLMKNVEVNVGNTAASLDFKDETLPLRGYFMMPDNDTQLKYRAVVTANDGKEVVKENYIDVLPGHHYILNFQTDPSQSTTGGAFFDIEIKEFNEEVENEFIIYGKPAFSWGNPNLKIDGQIVHFVEENDPFVTEFLRVGAYNEGFESMELNTGNMSSYLGGNAKYDLVNVENTYDNYLDQLKNYGIEVIKSEEPNSNGLYVWQIIFHEFLLNSLAPSTDEYYMTLTATDKSGKSAETKIRIANTRDAVKYDDPIVVDFTSFEKDFTAVNATSAMIPVTVVDNSLASYLQYRIAKTEGWSTQNVKGSRAGQTYEVYLTGLSENTTYEYRVVAGEENSGIYEFESDIHEFKTEGRYQIPNGKMESWFNNGSSSKPLWEPGEDASHSFWDSGNHGSANYGYVLCQASTDYARSGSCAKLTSVLAVIQFAAGNLFVGEFVQPILSSPMGAEVIFGQKYNGSHPKALKFYAKYDPAAISHKSDRVPDDEFKNSATDFGQVFVAIATQPFNVNTHEYRYFDPNDPTILGYGEVTWKESFGDPDGLKEVVLDIDYKESAKTTEATTLIIVASASKYGDYFAGGKGSTMYLDDFELVYE